MSYSPTHELEIFVSQKKKLGLGESNMCWVTKLFPRPNLSSPEPKATFFSSPLSSSSDVLVDPLGNRARKSFYLGTNIKMLSPDESARQAIISTLQTVSEKAQGRGGFSWSFGGYIACVDLFCSLTVKV